MHSRNRALDRPQGCVQKFCKGGANLGYFKKRGGGGGGGVLLQAASGRALEDNV